MDQGFHNFPATDRVVYGVGAADALAAEAKRLDAKRVFLIVSRTLNTKTDEIENIRQALGSRNVGIVDGIAQHTTRQEVVDVARAANRKEADLIVAIGGGSLIDLAKMVIMAMEYNLQDEADFDPYIITPDMNFRDAETPFRAPKVRQIAIPSTLNGGEFNAASLLTDTRTNLKQIFFHPEMMPISIILDPALTLHTPMDIWMGSGTRAMDHGIEALCSPFATPLTTEVVLVGIRKLRESMLRTLEDPSDIEARQQAQFGAWLSSFGLQARVPMGASHGIGHVLGGTYKVPHYFCTPVMLPSVLRYNKPYVEAAQRRLAEALGAPGLDAADAFERFTKKLGLPGSLHDVGITPEQFSDIARAAMPHRFIQANPGPLRTEKAIVSLLELAA